MVTKPCGNHDLLFTIYHSPFTSYGKEIINSEISASTEVCGARLHPLQEMRPGTRLSAKVQFVPHLFSPVGARGADPRRR
ncbi:MAG TPA: hypothetical protein VJU86_16265 [Pyrinomonadaceae bacterium]|nr:hypothetical protein [Pyrinomonadaceae bacterium]